MRKSFRQKSIGFDERMLFSDEVRWRLDSCTAELLRHPFRQSVPRHIYDIYPFSCCAVCSIGVVASATTRLPLSATTTTRTALLRWALLSPLNLLGLLALLDVRRCRYELRLPWANEMAAVKDRWRVAAVWSVVAGLGPFDRRPTNVVGLACGIASAALIGGGSVDVAREMAVDGALGGIVVSWLTASERIGSCLEVILVGSLVASGG